MAISRFSTSSVAQGLPKYQKLWDGTSVIIESDFELIERVTVGSGGSSSVSFSSIPGTYKHLQLRIIARDTSAATSGYDITYRFNSDSGASYARHYLIGDGASVYINGSTAQTYAYGGFTMGGGQLASSFSANIVDILDYTNTNKYKVVRSIAGTSSNASTANDYAAIHSSAWHSTSAITSIVANNNSGTNFAQYSTFALYGIR